MEQHWLASPDVLVLCKQESWFSAFVFCVLCPVCLTWHRVTTVGSGGPGSALSLASGVGQPQREGAAIFTLLPNNEPLSQMLGTNLPCRCITRLYNWLHICDFVAHITEWMWADPAIRSSCWDLHPWKLLALSVPSTPTISKDVSNATKSERWNLKF